MAHFGDSLDMAHYRGYSDLMKDSPEPTPVSSNASVATFELEEETASIFTHQRKHPGCIDVEYQNARLAVDDGETTHDFKPNDQIIVLLSYDEEGNKITYKKKSKMHCIYEDQTWLIPRTKISIGPRWDKDRAAELYSIHDLRTITPKLPDHLYLRGSPISPGHRFIKAMTYLMYMNREHLGRIGVESSAVQYMDTNYPEVSTDIFNGFPESFYDLDIDLQDLPLIRKSKGDLVLDVMAPRGSFVYVQRIYTPTFTNIPPKVTIFVGSATDYFDHFENQQDTSGFHALNVTPEMEIHTYLISQFAYDVHGNTGHVAKYLYACLFDSFDEKLKVEHPNPRNLCTAPGSAYARVKAFRKLRKYTLTQLSMIYPLLVRGMDEELQIRVQGVTYGGNEFVSEMLCVPRPERDEEFHHAPVTASIKADDDNEEEEEDGNESDRALSEKAIEDWIETTVLDDPDDVFAI